MIEMIKRLCCSHKWKIIDKVKVVTCDVEKTELTLQCEKCGWIKYKRPSSFM